MESIVSLDTTLIFWIQNHLVAGGLSPLMIGLSTLGNIGAVWILLGAVLLCSKKYRCAGIAIFIGLAFSLLVGNGVLKHLVMRARPCMDYPWMPMVFPGSGFCRKVNPGLLRKIYNTAARFWNRQESIRRR